MTRRLLLLLAGLALAAAPACRPLYLPLVPSETSLPPVPERLRLSEVRVEAGEGGPVVTFVPQGVTTEGWLAVQWYPPSGASVASASVWLSSDRAGETLRVPFPDDVPRTRQGRWRAVLSYEARILRQVSWEEPLTP